MKVIARLEYELAYYDSAVHRLNHYTTRTPFMREAKKILNYPHVYIYVYIYIERERERKQRSTYFAKSTYRLNLLKWRWVTQKYDRWEWPCLTITTDRENIQSRYTNWIWHRKMRYAIHYKWQTTYDGRSRSTKSSSHKNARTKRKPTNTW